MKEKRIKCKLITPLFMAGNDKDTPELRPSGFKGMTRFWWRAIRAEDNVDNLRKKEAEIFGGSGEKEGKSKVMIKVIPEAISTSSYRPLPHSDTKKFPFSCIKENSTFDIILTAEANLISFFTKILVLSTILGGFGKRARRGFGSIEIVEPKEFSFGDLDKDELLIKILEILKQLGGHYEIQNSKIVNTNPGADYPWVKQIEIGNRPRTWELLLTEIGRASHNHKNPSLGSASPRLASPIYVSIIRLKTLYYPIVTTLNSAFPRNYNFNLNKQNDFKRQVLS